MTTLIEPVDLAAKAVQSPGPAEGPGVAPSETVAGQTRGGFGWVDRLLRDRRALVAEITSGEGMAELVRAMILTILFASGVFGAALGAYRGGWQILFAALKLPLVLLLTACVCAPVLTAVRRVVQGRGELRRDLALLLASLALASLVQAALVPLFILATRLGAGYHQLVLLAVAMYGAGGLAGLLVLGRGLGAAPGAGRLLVVQVTVTIFFVVAAQMAWVLRPYLVRPRTPQPPVVRALEGNVIDAVSTSLRSAAGIYDVSRFERRDAGERQQP